MPSYRSKSVFQPTLQHKVLLRDPQSYNLATRITHLSVIWKISSIHKRPHIFALLLPSCKNINICSVSFSGTTNNQCVDARLLNIQVEILDQKKGTLLHHLISGVQSCCLFSYLWGRTSEDREQGEKVFSITHSGVYGVPIYTGHAILEILFFHNLSMLLPAPTVIQMSF